jgi:cytochrome c
VADGAAMYASQCAVCHGVNGEGTPYDALVAKESTGKTIGSLWPYATTVFDYIRRAMPFENTCSLSNEEVYSLTAFLLYKNELISEDTIMDAESLPKVAMPNLKEFTPDERENHNFPY